MSNVTEAYEKLQQHLHVGQIRAERLGRLMSGSFDEAGLPTFFVIPQARHLVAASMIEASEAADTIACEHNDTRWVGVVALLHNAGSRLEDHQGGVMVTITAADARAAAVLLGTLRERVEQLRRRRQSGEIKVTLR